MLVVPFSLKHPSVTYQLLRLQSDFDPQKTTFKNLKSCFVIIEFAPQFFLTHSRLSKNDKCQKVQKFPKQRSMIRQKKPWDGFAYLEQTKVFHVKKINKTKV